jgi:sulfoxide reductase heme-binding subunit YedZ
MSAAASESTTSAAAPNRRAPGKPHPWLEPGVLLGALVPLAVLIARAARGTLGADPVAIALNQLGRLALVLLLCSLAATPLRHLFGVRWPQQIRRLLGLLAFFYASLHFGVYALVDQQLALAAIAEDVSKRPFIMAGFSALLLLVPLAATSTKAMIRRLGGARWRRLHRLVYVAGSLAVLHFVWRVKSDLTQPLAYAAVLLFLFAVRVRHALGSRSAASRLRSASGRST